jgi:arginyl-tRNA synthetase
MIGNSLYHLYTAAGWKAIRINFLGDWGTAFGRLIAGKHLSFRLQPISLYHLTVNGPLDDFSLIYDVVGWHREKLTLADLEKAESKVTFLNDLYVRISKLSKARAISMRIPR